MLTSLLFLFVLVLINAFFAASEIALISLNDNKIRAMAEEGDKKALQVANLLKDPGRFLATIQIGITLAGFLASASASETFAEPLVAALTALGTPVPVGIIKSVIVFLITVILSYFTLVLGELVPKRLAMQKAEPIAFFAAGPLNFILRTAKPFVRLLTTSTDFIVRLFGVDPHAQDEQVTEEEIRMMVDVGEEKGAIDESEKEMINNIFEFDNKIAADVMTHRTEIVGIRNDASFTEISELVNREKYTRFPVYRESVDHIVGILHIKDLLPCYDNACRDRFHITDAMRRPHFVPESKPVDELFREMKKLKAHMAVVIDEYGGTAGIVTIEDLIEEIVGNIFDEYDEEERFIEPAGEDTWLIDGAAELDMVAESLELDLPVSDYDTLAGYVISLLGRIPQPDEKPSVEHANVVYAVVAMDDKKISRVRVRKLPVQEEP